MKLPRKKCRRIHASHVRVADPLCCRRRPHPAWTRYIAIALPHMGLRERGLRPMGAGTPSLGTPSMGSADSSTVGEAEDGTPPQRSTHRMQRNGTQRSACTQCVWRSARSAAQHRAAHAPQCSAHMQHTQRPQRSAARAPCHARTQRTQRMHARRREFGEAAGSVHGEGGVGSDAKLASQCWHPGIALITINISDMTIRILVIAISILVITIDILVLNVNILVVIINILVVTIKILLVSESSSSVAPVELACSRVGPPPGILPSGPTKPCPSPYTYQVSAYHDEPIMA